MVPLAAEREERVNRKPEAFLAGMNSRRRGAITTAAAAAAAKLCKSPGPQRYFAAVANEDPWFLRMLPPGRRRLALAWLALLLSSSSVPCKGATRRDEHRACYSNSRRRTRTSTSTTITAGFITAGSFQPTASTATTKISDKAWRCSLPGVKGASPYPGRTAGSSRHKRVASARRDEDDLGEPAVSNIPDSISSHGVDASPAPRWTLPVGTHEDVGVEGSGVREEPGVHSLVDLVKLLHASDNPLWELVRFEGRQASKQSHVSSMIHGSVLARTSLEDAVSCDVASKMATTFLSPTEVRFLMSDMYADEPLMDFVVAEDLLAHAMQDTSLPDVLTAMLYHKGFTALTTYRLMHWLWRGGRQNLARYLQSICSEVCAADIHPASKIGKGILMASGCDIVIGETAVVGDGVCLLQGVTLGGTGNQTGNRHPKVGKRCHIGAGSSILGNIPLGEGSRIEAASVVVKPVKPFTINRGIPSKTVAWIVCDPFQDVGDGVKQVDEGGYGEDGMDQGEVQPRRLFFNYGSLYIGV